MEQSQEEKQKVELVSTTRPIALDMLKENLTSDVDFSQDDWCDFIKDILNNEKERCFILVAFEGTEKIVGFIIAWIPYYRNFVHLHQVWIDSDLEDKSFMRLGMTKLVHWAELMDVYEVRGSNRTTPISLLKRFNFKVHSYQMRRVISSA